MLFQENSISYYLLTLTLMLVEAQMKSNVIYAADLRGLRTSGSPLITLCVS